MADRDSTAGLLRTALDMGDDTGTNLGHIVLARAIGHALLAGEIEPHDAYTFATDAGLAGGARIVAMKTCVDMGAMPGSRIR
jgi:hypothetical protein